jgi:type VI secretion system protein ImpC
MLAVAICAGFAGNPPTRLPLSDRRFALIDRDNFDEVLARIAPELHLPFGTLRFNSLDSFEPLGIARQVPALARLLDGEPPPEEAPASPPAPQPQASPPPGGLLDEILAQAEGAPARENPFVRSLVDEALKGARTYRKEDPRARQAILAAVAAGVCQVLHHPEFQALESAWRCLHRLVLASDTGTDLKLRVIDARLNEASEVAQRAFHGGQPFGLLILGYDVGPGEAGLLRAMVERGGRVIAGASPRLVGVDDWRRWKPAEGEDPQSGREFAEWRELRGSPAASRLTLVGPRVMARLPYGKGLREAEGMPDMEEVGRWPSGKPRALPHEQHLWGCASYLCAEALLAREEEVGRLPAFVYEEEGEMEMKCPVEAGLGAPQAEVMAQLGLLGVVPIPRTDRVRLAGAWSLAG